MLRPVRFVQADEDVFRANAAKFTKETGVEVKVDFVGWEDINQQTAVTSNSGAGPDIIIGFSDAPHIYVDKLVELTDVADYLGKRYGGWLPLAQNYGKQQQERRLDRTAVRRHRRPADLPQVDPAIGRLRQGAGRSCRIPRPVPEAAEGRQAGRLRARQRQVGDGNGFANWVLWSHNASLLDEEGNVIINSKETIAALNWVKELYPTFIAGTPSWNDVSNNRAYSSQEISLTANGVSLYFSLKNDPATEAIAEDSEHQLLPKGLRQDLADGGPDAERDGVQAQPVSQRRKGVPAIHAGKGPVRAVAQRQLAATGRSRSRPMPTPRCGPAIPRSRSSRTP